jgi:nitrate/TMAO reductase-like tetraheme cytochrome c subunit
LTLLTTSPLAVLELACAALSAAILVAYLVLRPPLVRATKLWLLLGLGVFPIGAAFAGNVHGFEATKKREFCGSCHVMALHRADSDDPASGSLASRHARNAMFGDENCYVCHADYGMFGTIVTKAGGMRHVWLYLTEYRTTSLEEAKKTIHLREPEKMNGNCMECHSTDDPLWLKVSDHRASLEDVRAGRLGCASEGCHGLAHPFFRPPGAGEAR